MVWMQTRSSYTSLMHQDLMSSRGPGSDTTSKVLIKCERLHHIFIGRDSFLRLAPAYDGIERGGDREVAMSDEHGGLLDRVEGTACPRCEGALFPVATRETPEGFAFGCSHAHIVTLR